MDKNNAKTKNASNFVKSKDKQNHDQQTIIGIIINTKHNVEN